MRAEVFDKDKLRLGGEREGFTLSSMTQMALKAWNSSIFISPHIFPSSSMPCWRQPFFSSFWFSFPGKPVWSFSSWSLSFLFPLCFFEVCQKNLRQILGKVSFDGKHLLDAVQGMREPKIFEAEERMGKTIHDNPKNSEGSR